MKQLIRWNEKEKKISVISSFTQDEAERRIEDYVNGISCGHADLNRKDLTAEIVFPDGSSEFLQVTDVPGDDTIRVDTRLGKLEASVNNGPGLVGIDICLRTAGETIDLIDVAGVSLWTDEVMRTKMGESCDDIRIMSFYNPFDEDYPDDGLKILYGKEVREVCGLGPCTADWKNADLVAYTDGSYNKKEGCFGAGVVMFKKGCDPQPLLYSKKGFAPEGENGWQVNGEIAAAETAIREAVKAGARSLEIRYDYEGVEKWATGVWRRTKSYTKKYAEYVDSVRNDLAITFTHVKAHSGVAWNDLADQMAKKACGAE